MNRTAKHARFSPPRFFPLIILVLVGSWLGVAPNVLADEPWKDKEPSQWSPADVRRILDKSPWSGTTFIEAHWVKPGSDGPVIATQIGKDPPTRRPTEVLDREKPVRHYAIRWFSSHTIREAMQIDRGRLPRVPGSVSRALFDPGDDSILLVIQGDDMTPFRNTSEEALKGESWLRPRKTGKKVAPLRVQIVETGRNAPGVVLFYFPRRDENGEPLIEPGERQVDFQSQAWQATFTMKFEPRKMVNKQGSDF